LDVGERLAAGGAVEYGTVVVLERVMYGDHPICSYFHD
jgi:hypothetical protein